MIFDKLKSLMNLVENEKNDILEKYIPEVDFMSIADTILTYAKNDKVVIHAKEDLGGDIEELIYMILNISQYIETDTTMESILSDDIYDQLHETYINLTGHTITGTNHTSGGNRPIKQHRFPELRGSLDKVHFIYENEVPDKDSRKSLEQWFSTLKKKADSVGIDTNTIEISYWYKYDGVSGVFEASKQEIHDVLTRKDTDTNTGTVITHIFNDVDMIKVFGEGLPNEVYNLSDYGVKTEIFMKFDSFEEFKKIAPRTPKNHRSAASMIINTLADEFDPDWRKYLTVEPLQISTTEKLALSDNDVSATGWFYVGMENGRYQYIRSNPQTIRVTSKNPFEYILSCAENYDIKFIEEDAERNKIPVDGVVYTILNKDIVNEVGRSDNKNKYQVAFKFAAGVAKTKLQDVIFTVGPVGGVITPVAIVEPVVIMGNTITNISLSNIDKMEKMNLRIGDEVMIKYNIIPTMYKDETCKSGLGKRVLFPMNCPVCGEELKVIVHESSNNRSVRCINLNCPRKQVGKISNYIEKMKIENIGPATVEDLCGIGVLKTIGDLYRIQNYKFDILRLPGYGELKYNNMIKSINTRLVVYPHELLGSIGIPSLGRRIMKKICSEIDIHDLLNQNSELIPRLIKIDGISDKTAIKLCEGLIEYNDIILDVMNYVELKPYEEEDERSIKVLFSKVRSKELEEILINKYNAEIQESYTKDTDILIVPDKNVSSTKITKAREAGKTILTLEEAQKLYHE